MLNPRGLALSHPLHYYLGRAAILLDVVPPAFAVTLVSALGGALAAANTYGCVLTCTHRRLPAVYAACSLALAHTVWQLATQAETYTLGIALLSGELWAMLLLARDCRARWALLLLALNGLGIANHMQAALTTPVVFGVVADLAYRNRLAWRTLVVGIVLWGVATLPYTGLVVSEIVQSGEVAATVRSALFGKSFAPAVLNVAPTTHHLRVTAAFVLLSFPNLLLPAAAVGMHRLWRRRRESFVGAAVLTGLVVHLLFAARYDVVDQHTFFLPTYTFLCVLGGVGLADAQVLLSPSRRRTVQAVAFAILAVTPAIYAIVPPVARSLGALNGLARNKPYRDDYEYLLAPWSLSDTSAQRMSTEAMELAGDRGVIIVEDSMARAALLYQRHVRGQSDVVIIPAHELETDAALPDDRAAVFVPLDRNHPSDLPGNRPWHRMGDLYVSEPRSP